MSLQPSRQQPFGWGPRRILLTAFGGVLITVSASVLAWWLLDRPRSEIPPWIEAGATVVGVGAAIVAGFYAARAFLLEFRREERWEESNRSAQASRVAAWPLELQIECTSSIGDDGYQVPVPVAVRGVSVRLRNASDLPIAGVRVVASVMVARPDTFTDEVEIGVGEVAHVDPESTIDIHVAAGSPGSLRPLLDTSRHDIRVFLQFKDAVGRDWSRRTHEGDLNDSGTRSERTMIVPANSRRQRRR